jgi:hypothetical protein
VAKPTGVLRSSQRAAMCRNCAPLSDPVCLLP